MGKVLVLHDSASGHKEKVARLVAAGAESIAGMVALEEKSMDLQLTNKKALVTGSTAGIGFAIASHLDQKGPSPSVASFSDARAGWP
jgi:hypothetical protein